jgi:hypothetical protein
MSANNATPPPAPSVSGLTRPTLPGLVARWREWGSENRHKGHFDIASAQFDCAAELAQTLALSDEEREAIEWCDTERKRMAGFIDVAIPLNYYDTLRALVHRLTAASDGGGKGEDHE